MGVATMGQSASTAVEHTGDERYELLKQQDDLEDEIVANGSDGGSYLLPSGETQLDNARFERNYGMTRLSPLITLNK